MMCSANVVETPTGSWKSKLFLVLYVHGFRVSRRMLTPQKIVTLNLSSTNIWQMPKNKQIVILIVQTQCKHNQHFLFNDISFRRKKSFNSWNLHITKYSTCLTKLLIYGRKKNILLTNYLQLITIQQNHRGFFFLQTNSNLIIKMIMIWRGYTKYR